MRVVVFFDNSDADPTYDPDECTKTKHDFLSLRENRKLSSLDKHVHNVNGFSTDYH